GRLRGVVLGLGCIGIVRYRAFKEEIFQAWIPKIRISTDRGPKPIILQSSSARIQGNTISGNRSTGITVSENSEARIGFPSGSAGTFSAPNVIQNNQGAGILLGRSSSARITGNTIINNTGGGVALSDGSTADIGPVGGEGTPNTITGNGGGGGNAKEGGRVGRFSSAAVVRKINFKKNPDTGKEFT